MKIGMLGHRGFIGTNLKNRLENDHELVLNDEKLGEYSVSRTLPRFYDMINCDLIINLAGKNKGTDREIIETNVKGTKDLVEWCLSLNKPLILAGTDYKQESVYKLSKDTIKILCKSYEHLGLNSTVLNLPKVIGPGCKPHYNSFVTTLIYLASKGVLDQYLYLIKNMHEWIELIHVDDVCDVIIDHIDRPSLMCGFAEYEFTKLDGLFGMSFENIVDVLKTGKYIEDTSWCKPHIATETILRTLQWYKDYPNG